MYLKEVIINGFKSFADRTKVSLDSGITCVVGPNGCGKSNIVESIRWVLGEQRAKALRGGKMQDVIFQGTDKRKQLPSCEVSLVFTDCEKELGTNYNEVEIKRRVTRDGGGNYYINGKSCRLKDIHRLFMDTGIGHSSYSFMMQGQIDQILSSNPSERRAIFEEAAGITKYKAQRKEALNKLGLVDQNLARVTDRVEELGRQIGSLKRQASKALRYKRFKHRLTHLDLSYNGYHYTKRHTLIKELDEKTTNFRKIVEETQVSLDEHERSLESRKGQRTEVYNQLQEAQQNVFNLRSEKENAESQIEFAKIRGQDIEERIEEISKEVVTLNEQLSDLENKTQDTVESKDAAKELVDSSDDIFKEKNQAFQSIIQELSQLENGLQRYKQDLLVLEGGITRLRSQCTSCEVDLKSFEVKHAGFSDTIFQLNEERLTLETKHQEIIDTTARRQVESDEAETAVAESKEKVGQLRVDFKELQRDIQSQDREVARLSAQLSTLEALQAKFEGFSEGAKAILQGQLGDALPKGSFRPFSKLFNPAPEYLHALETLLGAAGEAISLDEPTKASSVTAILEEQKLGRACLQIAVPEGSTKKGPDTLPDWLKPAASVSNVEGELSPLANDFLAGCYFCDDLQAFLDFWNENPSFDFFLVATITGELIDRKGLVYGGRKVGRKKESSFIQREKQIAQLKVQIAKDNETLTQLNEKALQMQADIESAENTVEEKRKRQVEIGQELSSLKSEERSSQNSLNQNAQNISRNQHQLDQLEQSRSDAEARLDKAQADMKSGEEKINAKREEITQNEDRIKQLRIERDGHQDGLAEVRLDLAEKKQRLEMLARGLNEAQAQKQELQTRAVRRRQEIDSLHEQSEQLTSDIETNTEKSGEIQRTLEVTMQSLEQNKKTLAELEKQINDAESHMSGTRNAQRDREVQLNADEIKLAEERSQANFLIEKVRTEYEKEITDIDWKQELWKADEEFENKIRLDELEDEDAKPKVKKDRGDPTEEDFAAMEETDWDEVSGEIKHLRDRINSLGAVNLVAIEEYAELKERYDFLTTQSDDLWKSKEELLKGIDEINETSKTLFQDTFAQIRKNFVFTFEKLFGGGEADLELIEAEDVLDSGIEITARPPGTKLRSLSLLSGGQRTMTAVGLLFAIYMVKPSPFCVLDELDAPLDDANIGRFCDMLKQFTNYSQFLVVTHNKRTVGAANSIYGVTMQERGVTKLISMRFNPKTNDTESVDEDAAALV